jgi:hypothetical protein
VAKVEAQSRLVMFGTGWFRWCQWPIPSLFK